MELAKLNLTTHRLIYFLKQAVAVKMFSLQEDKMTAK